MAYNWTGHGLDDKFGAADYAAALAAGKSRAQIRSYLDKNPGAKRVGTKIDSLLAGDQGGKRSDLGVSRDASGISTPTQSQLTQFGKADERHYRAVLEDKGITGAEADLQIANYVRGLNNLQSGYASGAGAQLEQRASNIEMLQSQQEFQQSQLSLIRQQMDAAAEAEEQRRLDRLKVKFQGSTKVDNPSAMGIRFAQSPTFKGSSTLSGLGQLSRSSVGRQLTNLNV